MFTVVDLRKKLREYKDEAKLDSIIDKMKLDESIHTITSLRLKWKNRHLEWLEVLNNFQETLTDKYNDIRLNIDSTSQKQFTKQELHELVLEDKEYREYLKIKVNIEIVATYCKDIDDLMGNKQWNLKLYLDYLNYINGVK